LKVKNLPSFDQIKDDKRNLDYIMQLFAMFGFSYFSRTTNVIYFNLRTSRFRDHVKNNEFYFSSKKQEFPDYCADFFSQYFSNAEDVSLSFFSQIFPQLDKQEQLSYYLKQRQQELGSTKIFTSLEDLKQYSTFAAEK
jgi:hypothetical protein